MVKEKKKKKLPSALSLLSYILHMKNNKWHKNGCKYDRKPNAPFVTF
jgi:hypothetical protein